MILEEAIILYEDGAKITWNGKPTANAKECQQMVEWLKDYKRLLEQEPCEVSQGLVKDSQGFSQEPCDDAISRSAVLDLPRIKTHNVWGNVIYESVDVENVRRLPSVTPQPKMGHWKAFTHSAYRGNDEDGEPIWREVTVYHCDLCNRRTVIKEKYCPNCGCAMKGELE